MAAIYQGGNPFSSLKTPEERETKVAIELSYVII